MFSCSRERRHRNISSLIVVMECTHDDCDRWNRDAYLHIALDPNNKTQFKFRDAQKYYKRNPARPVIPIVRLYHLLCYRC